MPIFASKLRELGVEVELIELLQGRIGKRIFLQRYYRSNLSYYRGKILDTVNKLRKEIEK
jgi:intergrase/recombinase